MKKTNGIKMRLLEMPVIARFADMGATIILSKLIMFQQSIIGERT